MKQTAQGWQIFIKALQLGWDIASPLIVLTIGGYFLDKKFQTKPLFILTGLGLSIIITFFILFREVKKVLKE